MSRACRSELRHDQNQFKFLFCPIFVRGTSMFSHSARIPRFELSMLESRNACTSWPAAGYRYDLPLRIRILPLQCYAPMQTHAWLEYLFRLHLTEQGMLFPEKGWFAQVWKQNGCAMHELCIPHVYVLDLNTFCVRIRPSYSWPGQKSLPVLMHRSRSHRFSLGIKIKSSSVHYSILWMYVCVPSS